MSIRRQHINDLYIGLNTVFLTALGFLILQSGLNTWWIAAIVGAIGAVVTPLNLVWRATLVRYGQHLALRFDYIREVEKDLQESYRGSGVRSDVGVHLRVKKAGMHRKGNTQLERVLATYFIVLYPTLAVVVAVIVLLARMQLIPPLALR